MESYTKPQEPSEILVAVRGRSATCTCGWQAQSDDPEALAQEHMADARPDYVVLPAAEEPSGLAAFVSAVQEAGCPSVKGGCDYCGNRGRVVGLDMFTGPERMACPYTERHLK